MDKRYSDLNDRPILIIDDEEELRKAMLELLLAKGFAAEGVADGRAALERLQYTPVPWLIILDLKMPVMDGRAFRAAQARCAVLRSIPVVLVTGEGDVEAHALALQVDGYLKKPVGAGELEDLLRTMRRRHRATAARQLV